MIIIYSRVIFILRVVMSFQFVVQFAYNVHSKSSYKLMIFSFKEVKTVNPVASIAL